MGSKNKANLAYLEGTRLIELFQTSSVMAKRWDAIDDTLQYCAKNMHYMESIGSGKWLNEGLAHSKTIVEFFNDTVNFIVTGEPRRIPITAWASMIVEALNIDDNRPDSVLAGNVGTGVALISTAKPNFTSAMHYKDQISKIHLLYAKKELLFSWTMRENGIDDMLQSVVLFARIFSTLEREH